MNSSEPWFLNPIFLPSAFGFLGVIIGGLLTFFSSFFLQWYKDRSDRKREKRIHRTAIQTAARLLDLGLGLNLAELNSIRNDEQTWPGAALSGYAPGAWTEQLRTVSSVLTYKEWMLLQIGVIAVGAVHLLRQRPRPTAKDLNERLSVFAKSIEEAQAILHTLVTEHPRD